MMTKTTFTIWLLCILAMGIFCTGCFGIGGHDYNHGLW